MSGLEFGHIISHDSQHVNQLAMWTNLGYPTIDKIHQISFTLIGPTIIWENLIKWRIEHRSSQLQTIFDSFGSLQSLLLTLLLQITKTDKAMDSFFAIMKISQRVQFISSFIKRPKTNALQKMLYLIVFVVSERFAPSIHISTAWWIFFIQPWMNNRHIVIPLSQEKIARFRITQMMTIHKLHCACIESTIPSSTIWTKYAHHLKKKNPIWLHYLSYLFETTAPS